MNEKNDDSSASLPSNNCSLVNIIMWYDIYSQGSLNISWLIQKNSGTVIIIPISLFAEMQIIQYYFQTLQGHFLSEPVINVVIHSRIMDKRLKVWMETIIYLFWTGPRVVIVLPLLYTRVCAGGETWINSNKL